jgi:hypothetical protein
LAVNFLHGESRDHAILTGRGNVNIGKLDGRNQSGFQPLLISAEFLDLIMGRPPLVPQHQCWIATVWPTVSRMKRRIHIPDLRRQPSRRRGKQSPSRDDRQSSAIVGIHHDPSPL